MRAIVPVSIFIFCVLTIKAQKQLEVQGNPSSTDTVASIKVNYSGNIDVVGLRVYSEPSTFYGIGGHFYGGSFGIFAESEHGEGVRGRSETGIGVEGFSIDGRGMFGYSQESNGVEGLSRSSRIGVYGISYSNVLVYSNPPNGAGVQGTSFDGNGVYGESVNAPGVFGTGHESIGVHGKSTDHTGVYGESDAWNGVYGKSTDHTGVYGESDKWKGMEGISTSSIGVRGESSTGDGLWGESSMGAGVIGSGGPSDYDFNAIGPGMDYGATSSKRWKNSIKNIDNPIDKLTKLRGVYFNWDEDHGGHYDIGFIAEEIGKVLPEIVVYEENGVDASGMDYSKMTPLLVEASNAMRREYQQRLEAQELRIELLEQELAEIKAVLTKQGDFRIEDE